MPKQSRPVSDHFDGERFFNPGPGLPPKDLADVVRWRTGGGPAGGRTSWPERVIDPAMPPPPASVASGMVAVSFVGHASFLLRFSSAVVLTDPMFSERCSPVSWAGPKRARAPGIALSDLPRPDLVLLSHNHYDHLDLPSLRAINRRFAPRVVTMLGNARTLRAAGIDAEELDWWKRTVAGPLGITATPARHFSARTPFDRNRALWGGFMIEADGGRLLFAGDSGMGAHWSAIGQRLGAPDVALLPIGAYEPRWFMAPVHMNPAEAVQAHLDLGARRSVGMHFGTFQLTDEAIDAPLSALADAKRGAGLADEVFVAHGFGETRVYAIGEKASGPF